MKKTLKLAALALAALMLLTGFACAKTDTAAETAEDDYAYIQEKGTLTIGITEYAPMNYYDEDGNLIGFDTEFAEAACTALGLTPDFVVIDWDSKELELSSKKIDCIWNGLTVTEERRANMDFTIPYLKNQQVVVIRSADADAYTSAESFSGLEVVAEAGSAGADAIAANMPDATFTEVQAQSDALLEVKAGKAAAAVVDLTMAKAMTGEGTDYSDLTIADIDMLDEEYAIGFRVGSTATEEFNNVIDQLSADGTLASLAEKYGLSDLLIQD